MRLPLCPATALAALGVVVSAVYGADTPPASSAWDLPRLMAGLQQVKSANAHFFERRYLSALTQPIDTSGTLAYVAPDKLRKQTLAPKPELLVVDGSKLTRPVMRQAARPTVKWYRSAHTLSTCTPAGRL